MSAIIEHFKTLTQIPRCSKEADKLMEFLVDFGNARDYSVEVDETKNILIRKGSPKLCLQAHYDMVCMGKAPKIETYEENGLMKAKDSSLGADNGMAIAMMMVLMDKGEELEFLITADEEVGLIGANALSFDLKSSVMLNVDTEEEAEVYIGCAGGVDINASMQDTYIDGIGECYEVAVKGLAGGHSGVDIDKGIPSAIKVLGEYLHEEGVTQLVSFYAGERRNSIPANAVAIVYSEKPLEEKGEVKTRVLNEKPQVLKEGAKALELIHTFKHGVHRQNKELGIPDTSINLAIITTDEKGGLLIETSARAMSAQGLKEISDEAVELFKSYDFDVRLEDKYPSWKPDVTDFTELVSEEVKKVFGKSKMTAIHAGLECGVISEKYPHMKFASIGPTIRFPHSTREEVDLKSVEKTFEVVLGVIQQVK
ncbi:M20/M25/M40 family metallo-hydrolase [Sulfurovum sp. zt1-1]|uniref:M20/M25/M40 family metallo-hydrolase n=1 Tax=Sulfurovum zhangzhouensis TaxID=3019067 RepID=A0ABT7QWB7_9BACT|nr:M20/M25/M40 family metallo-hydrolase [Sulfurovum zhangzhouensis]MDM5271129.1 M20/M25/M40 family metallo-hydrolase [Sulfurovum zhangzhouensis]